MKRNYLYVLTFSAVFIFGAQTVSAQFTITIPKLPKINRPRQEPAGEARTTTSTGQGNDPQKTENKPVVTKDKCTQSGWLERHLEEISKRQSEVSSFTPERGWFTKDFTYDHLLHAVSPSAREKWLKDSNAVQFKDCQNLIAAFDKLAAAAAEKFPFYTANPKAYNFRNPVEEKMMKATLKNAAAVKIHKIGLDQVSWLISKNELGLPTSRYKNGMIWLRDPADDHPYCHFYYVNILQDYSGGGTYGASYALFVENGLAGCPPLGSAGKF